MAFRFNSQGVPPPETREPLVKGWYPMVITACENKTTDAGTGEYLAVEFTVIDGPMKGRKFFTNFNHKNPSADATRIGNQQIASVCAAIGLIQIESEAQFLNRPLEVKLGLEGGKWMLNGKKVPENTPNAEFYDSRNKFVEARKLTGAASAAPGAVAAPTPTIAPPAWSVQAQQAAPAPAPAPAPSPAPAPAPAPIPAPPPPPPVVVAPVRSFFVNLPSMAGQLTTEAQIADFLKQGMPADTLLNLAGSPDWKTAKDYGIGAVVSPPAPVAQPAPAPALAASSAPTPPWLKK